MFATLFRTLVETLVFDLSFGSYDEAFRREGEHVSRAWGPLRAKVHYSYVFDADVFTLGVEAKGFLWQYQVVLGEDADVFTRGFSSRLTPPWMRRLRLELRERLTGVPF